TPMSTRDHKRRRRTATRIRRTGQTRPKQESHEAVVDEPIDADAREHYRREKARRAERSRPPDHPLEQARRAYHALLAADAERAAALRELGPEAGAKVMAALPFDLAVQVFDEPELDRHRAGIVSCMPPQAAAALVEAMSADQRADLVRELRETDRVKILKLL